MQITVLRDMVWKKEERALMTGITRVSKEKK